MIEQDKRDQITTLTADIVSAYVSNNPVPAADLANLIANIHRSMSALAAGEAEAPAETLKPAVPIKKSIQDDYIVCLEDGKKFKSLKRHIGVHYGLTPDEYRQKWNLSPDYPMVAPSYAASRSALAKSMGLGRKKSVPTPLPAKRGRKKTAASA